MGNKLVRRHGLHLYPFEPAEMILDTQSFFKQAAKFNLFELLYLALKNIEKKWTMPIRDWKLALPQFAIVFEGRMPLH